VIGPRVDGQFRAPDRLSSRRASSTAVSWLTHIRPRLSKATGCCCHRYRPGRRGSGRGRFGARDAMRVRRPSRLASVYSRPLSVYLRALNAIRGRPRHRALFASCATLTATALKSHRMSKARSLSSPTARADAAQQRSRTRIFLEDDLARHARPGSCWVTLDRKVYDVVRWRAARPR